MSLLLMANDSLNGLNGRAVATLPVARIVFPFVGLNGLNGRAVATEPEWARFDHVRRVLMA